MADRHVIYKNGGEGDRGPARAFDHLHGEVLDRRGRLVVPHPFERVVGRRRAVAACGTTDAPDHLSPVVPRLARRAARVRPGARVDVRADRQLVQALPARVVGADRAGVEPRQSHVRVPHRRPRAVVPAGVAHPRRRREPVPRVRGDDRGRAPRHRARRSIRAPRFDGNAYAAPDLARVPASLAEAVEAFASSKVAVDAFGADVHDAPAQHRPPGARRTSTARSPTGNAGGTSTSGSIDGDRRRHRAAARASARRWPYTRRDWRSPAAISTRSCAPAGSR